MRVLLCHNYYQQAGGEDHVFHDEAWLLRSQGHDVIEFTMHNDSLADMGRLDIIKKTFWNSDSARQLGELIEKHQPEVMHCANTFPLISPAAYYVAHEHNVAVVQTLHNYRLLCPMAQFLLKGSPCEKCLGKTFAWPSVVHGCYREDRKATAVVAAMTSWHRLKGTWNNAVDRYIALTEFSKEKFIQGGLPADRIIVKQNFLRQDPGVGAGRGDYAIFVGRLSPEKGLSTLLQAWSQLSLDMPLKIVGDGPMAETVAQAAAENPQIEWLGQRPLADVCSLVGEARCLVMPSVWYETFGRTVSEAFASGTPVIASRLGAMAELVDDGRTGLLFEPGNPDDLVVKINQFASQGERMADFRKAARKQYEEHFTAENNYELLMSVYEQALSSKRDTVGQTKGSPLIGVQKMSATRETRPAEVREELPTMWPKKVDLFGVQVSITDYQKTADALLADARRREPGVVSCHAVHAIITASCDPVLREQVNTFKAITPDGQPVRWALNLLHKAGLTDRVYGPSLTLELCRRAAEEGVSIYLYGGSPEVVEKLQANLCKQFPELDIAGYESPPFRQLTDEEDQAAVERINSSGAGLVFIGLGCPKQDEFAFLHQDRIEVPQVCVGAAFDFHAGKKSTAPAWMQRHGLEWLFRLASEPRRLWKRYLHTNSLFVAKLAKALISHQLRRLKRTSNDPPSNLSVGTFQKSSDPT